ncbi:hypothetical protein PGT21_033548 [Puccinia graminis f. sp. tritici]|uniref:PIG-P domain-containing protein n=1 Tax=Puccinia graminis f. sp. tritici TaxID=56615 RepID=A0A5B0NA26_PUCGR|nr:hypothetical protein PGTUg99_006094 [Puccinia graminis f. sp. tritici]KAA1084649.1 hypothetical protein PGT21_033548 [Puccinia graminis f. sp. tritici]
MLMPAKEEEARIKESERDSSSRNKAASPTTQDSRSTELEPEERGGGTGRRKRQMKLPAPGTNALATSAFATYVLSTISYTIYLLHGLLPSKTVEEVLGLSYFPAQVWTTILPGWLTIAIWYLFLAYFALNLSRTPSLDGPDGLAAITDLAALVLLPPPATRAPSPPRSSPHPTPHPSADSSDLPVPILRDLPCQVVNQFYFN